MYEAVAIGVSSGGLAALRAILPQLPADFPMPIAIVQHVAEGAGTHLPDLLDRHCAIMVKEADEKERLEPGTAYLAPAGYHLLVEPDRTFGLSTDQRVNFCCPAIDVLLETAADVYGDRLVGVILTGANGDGAQGLKAVKARGGLAVVQDPQEAEAWFMPQAAIDAVEPDFVGNLDAIARLLVELGRTEAGRASDVA
jgi:two-component system chemotaxis response regulator CheB